MMLKKVVLPAPFGPIRPTIDPRGIEKSTRSTATSPPNVLVTARASRRRSLPFTAAPARSWRLGRFRTQLCAAGAAREQTGRTQEHHQHQRQTKDHHLQVADFD